MKIEQVLVLYLLKNKHLTLQGIGTFQLDAAIPDSSDPDKSFVIPADAVTFHYDPKVKDEDDLIDFIVEHTNKIKPLASSDLDSFLSLGRQFLNIGKPFTFQNLGTLEKTNSGELIFKGGQLMAEKLEPRKLRKEGGELTEQEESLFNDYQKERKPNNGSKVIFILLILSILVFIGWVIWHYGFNKKSNVENLNSTEAIIPIPGPITDSDHTTDSSMTTGVANNANTVQRNPGDTFTFKIVVNEYYTIGAAKFRLDNLKSYGRNVIMYTEDSVTYKIAEPFKLPLSDTTKVVDSLKGYYSKVYLEVN